MANTNPTAKTETLLAVMRWLDDMPVLMGRRSGDAVLNMLEEENDEAATAACEEMEPLLGRSRQALRDEWDDSFNHSDTLASWIAEWEAKA